MLGHLARLLIVLHRDEDVARLRHAAETEDLHGRRRSGRVDPAALVVDHRPDPPVLRAAHEGVAHLERPLLDEHGRHRAATTVEPGLDDGALRQAVRRRAQLENIRLEEDHVEQLGDALLALRRHRNDDRVAAPVLGREPVIPELLLDAFGVRVGLVDLVDGDEDRHFRGARVVDGLDRLRHDAVVGGDD